MVSLSRLRNALIAALSPAGSQHGEQELFDQLVTHTQHLLNLYDVGLRSPQERRELESGVHRLSLIMSGGELNFNIQEGQCLMVNLWL